MGPPSALSPSLADHLMFWVLPSWMLQRSGRPVSSGAARLRWTVPPNIGHERAPRLTAGVGASSATLTANEVLGPQQPAPSSRRTNPARNRICECKRRRILFILYFLAPIAHSLVGFSVMTYSTPPTATGVARMASAPISMLLRSFLVLPCW